MATARFRAAASPNKHECLFYLYTSDPAVRHQHRSMGFDGCFGEKGNDEALLRQVRAVFRTLDMRQMRKRL